MNGFVKRLQDVFAGWAGKDRFERTDFVILRTLLMLAAVDGEVGQDEVARFKALAVKCRGCCGEGFGKLWDEAVRGAGYLLLQSRFLTRDELVAAFVAESEKGFVDEIARETVEERERAFRFLEEMAKADGDYSEVERLCVAALEGRVRAKRENVLADRYPRAARFGA